MSWARHAMRGSFLPARPQDRRHAGLCAAQRKHAADFARGKRSARADDALVEGRRCRRWGVRVHGRPVRRRRQMMPIRRVLTRGGKRLFAASLYFFIVGAYFDAPIIVGEALGKSFALPLSI